VLDFGRFTHLTFDCYGTLVDWEAGILDALRPMVARQARRIDEGDLLLLYARLEAEQESGPFRPYREVLRGVVAGIGAELGFTPTEDELDALADSVGLWPPFPDTVEALARLEIRYPLVILSNIDDAMFAETAKRLEVEFDEVITAQQIGSYKPARENFRAALTRLEATADRVLHVAQSLFHDHVPAKELGFTTVWVNRPSRQPGTGATLPAEAAPDLEVPDLRTLVEVMGL
jgi:2-haloacid dehalogenase